MAPARRKKFTRTKNRNTKRITDRAVVVARVNRWKHSDIGDASLYGYTRKLKEFKAFCENNEPDVLNTERVAKTLVTKLKLPESKKIACAFNLTKLKLSGYAAFELFMGTKLRDDNTNYTKEYYGGYRSAFKKIFNWQRVKGVEEFDELMSLIIGGITRIQKNDEKAGKRDRYDREGITYEEYVQICGYFLKQGDFKHLVMTVLEWNLMCRVNQLNELTSTRMKWVRDHLDVLFTSTKMSRGKDSATDDFSKRVFANPLEVAICPVTALGLYLLTSVTDSVKIFPGDYEDSHFTTALQEAGKALGWVNWEFLGSHSLRKGAWTYSQSGTTQSPSFAATCMRADHSLGNVKDRYFVKAAVGGAQDAYLGRLIVGLDVMSEEFSILPPHFTSDEEYILEKIHIVFSSNIDCFGVRFNGVLAKILASVVHHTEKLKTICPPTSKLWQNLLFRDPQMIPRLKVALNPDLYKSPQMGPTGIPPHVAILKKINKLDIDVKDAIMKAFEEYGIGQPQVTKRWTIRQFEGIYKKFDELATFFKNATQANTSTHQTLRSSLPSNYKMPAFKFQTGWSYWLFGDPSNNVAPFQFLKASEFSSKSCRNAFRSYRTVMLRVEKEVRKAHPSVDFKKEFKATNVITNLENVKRSEEYFTMGTAIVGNANNGKYIAKTDKSYKSKPVGELSISTVRRRMSRYVVSANATTSTTSTTRTTSTTCSAERGGPTAGAPTPRLGAIRNFLTDVRGVNIQQHI